jgi:hypothetical protein
MSTIMRAFDVCLLVKTASELTEEQDFLLPADVETNGGLNEAHRGDVVARAPMPWMNADIKKVYETYFYAWVLATAFRLLELNFA